MQAIDFRRPVLTAALVAFTAALPAHSLHGQTTAPATAAPRDTAELMISINEGVPLFAEELPVEISGKSTATPGSQVKVTVGSGSAGTSVLPGGTWNVLWTGPLPEGGYAITARVTDGGRTAETTNELRVQERGRLPRQPFFTPPVEKAAPPELPNFEDFKEYTDRWRIVPPSGYPITDKKSRNKFDPYNQNVLKGDLPYWGSKTADKNDDLFLVLTGISDTLFEYRTLPTPSGVSSENPGEIWNFGDPGQQFINQNIVVSAQVFKGLTSFRPFDWQVKATLIGNVNYLDVFETGIVKPDVRRGSHRTDGRGSVQELFYERKLRDLTSNFDFVSVRAGIQPFNSDFRGFIFSDTNMGVRLFGNYASNRYQYNLAFFERLEKDTNSGLNRNAVWRGQRVAIANVYRQDTFVPGYTAQLSLHHFQDDESFEFDRNGILARPDPVGGFTPHSVQGTYLGWAGLGHYQRINLDHAAYYVFGKDSLNPIAGPDPNSGRKSLDISAYMGAIEVSYDKDWLRPRFALFYASGDDDIRDRKGTGFETIFDNLNFVGGGFSFWNRLGIRLAGGGVTLVNRGSVLPDLRTSKDEGQPNFVNPGVQIISTGLDVELTPKAKTILTANYLRFDKTQVLEGLLFQGDIDNEIGLDLSAGLRFRPFLNNNVILVGGAAAFFPGEGFQDIYEGFADPGEKDDPLFQVFTNFILTF